MHATVVGETNVPCPDTNSSTTTVRHWKWGARSYDRLVLPARITQVTDETSSPEEQKRGEMATRPLVAVYSEKNVASGAQVKMPAVFRAPIRPDVVNFIHDQMRKNKRQPYAVSTKAGW